MSGGEDYGVLGLLSLVFIVVLAFEALRGGPSS